MKNFILNKFLFLFISIFFTIPLYAQRNNNEVVDLEELMNGRVHKVDELLYSNLSFIYQIGNENTVTTYQIQQGEYVNYSEIEQLNMANEAEIFQKGSGHNTKLFQNGIRNLADLYVVGDRVKTIMMQEGDNNSMGVYIENFTGPSRSANFLQKGNNNFINVALRGDNFQGIDDQWIKIKQFGNSHQAEAIIDPFSTPIEIIQTSAPGGEGMKVNVSTSAFYFPMK